MVYETPRSKGPRRDGGYGFLDQERVQGVPFGETAMTSCGFSGNLYRVQVRWSSGGLVEYPAEANSKTTAGHWTCRIDVFAVFDGEHVYMVRHRPRTLKAEFVMSRAAEKQPEDRGLDGC